METLVVVADHRNEYYSRNTPARFGSSPYRGFRDINCRTFQSGIGILPTPLKACNKTVTKRAFSSSPKTPSPSVNSHSEASKHLKKLLKSSSIPIPINSKTDFNKVGFFNEQFSYSELWAGPAYSNSPPPSSLPIPKFSLCSKRTVSLDLHEKSACDLNFHPIAKSAPASPTRDRSINFSSRCFFHSDDSATKTLRRILNLDITDE